MKIWDFTGNFWENSKIADKEKFIFFNSCKILIHLHLLLLKSIHFCMFIMQNSSEIVPWWQILSFLKNSPWNLKFSYIFWFSRLCVNEENWKKSQEIKLLLQSILKSVSSSSNFCHSEKRYVKDMYLTNFKAKIAECTQR